jgi:phosphate transport system protein
MGKRVDAMLASAVRAAMERDVELARATIAADDEVNAMERDVDAGCMRALIRRQPVASDMRIIVMTLKLVIHLERIGDLTVNISERALELASANAEASFGVDLSAMGASVSAMLRGAMDAYERRDEARASEVIEADAAIDRTFAATCETLLRAMSAPDHVYAATRLQSIAKNLERAGDHAANAAEMVIFMVRGDDVRHQGSGKFLSRMPPPMDSVEGQGKR